MESAKENIPVNAALILAAGASTRMGFPKQLIKTREISLIRKITDTAILAGFAPVVVVLGAYEDRIRPELAGLSVLLTVNPEWETGMGSSISRGVKTLQGLPYPIDNILILLTDQPLITAADCKTLLELKLRSRSKIAAAAYSGQLGVPAVFDKMLLPDLAALQGQSGAKSLFRVYESSIAALDLPAAALDLDTPEDLLKIG